MADTAQHHHAHAHDTRATITPRSPPAGGAVRDPVCGMTVDPHTTPHRAQHQGHTYYFCSAGCRDQVRRRSGEVSRRRASAPEPVPEGTIYTCPMHPEIRQVGPGSCPICGMALEPELATADTGPEPRARRHDAPLLDRARAVAAGGRAGDGRRTSPARTAGSTQTLSNWIQFAFATPVVLWAGWPFFVRGWQSVVTRNLNMFTLIAMGTGVAYLYSVVATLAPGLFPPAFRGHGGAVAVYFEAAAVITVLVLLGQVLELRARERTSGAIRALLGLQPKTARRVKPRRQRRGGRARRDRGRRPAARAARARKCRSTAT